MKQRLIAAAVGSSLGLLTMDVMAQTNVTIYGVIDTGVAYVTHANAAGDSVIKMPTITGTLPSRIGFKGMEDLGDGMAALFALESGFGPDTGASGQGNRLFGRQAWVGLKTNYGTVSLGRMLNMTLLGNIKSDVIGPSVFSTGSLDSYIPNARSDNAIGYINTVSNVTFGGTYSLGRDASAAGTNCPGELPGDPKACRQVTGLLSYDGNNAFGVTSAYDILYGGPGATAGMTSSDYSDRRTSLNGYVMLGQVKLGAGLIDRKVHTATDLHSDLYYIGASYPLSPLWQFAAEVAQLKIKDSPNTSTLGVMRLTNFLSKRTQLYGTVGYMRNQGSAAVSVDAGGTAGPGLNQVGVMLGMLHTF
jgi:predicted porin